MYIYIHICIYVYMTSTWRGGGGAARGSQMRTSLSREPARKKTVI